MSEQFAPLPYRALALAGSDPGSIALVVHLYTQAHTTRWGWLRVTVRELVDRTAVSKRRVEYLLDVLVDEGLAEREIVLSGGRKDGTRFRLLSPYDQRDTSGDTSGDTDETRSVRRNVDNRRASGHERDMTRDIARDTSTDLNERYEQTSREEERAGAQASAGEREQPSAPDAGDLVSDPTALRSALTDRHAPALAELLEHAQRTSPAHALSPADVLALRGALGRWTVDDLRAVWDHAQSGEGPMRLAVESGWSSSWSALAGKRLPDRVRDARLWAQRGRPAATGPPSRTARGGGPSADDGVLRALRESARRERLHREREDREMADRGRVGVDVIEAEVVHGDG